MIRERTYPQSLRRHGHRRCRDGAAAARSPQRGAWLRTLLGRWLLLVMLATAGAAHAAQSGPTPATPPWDDRLTIHDAAGNPLPPLAPQPLPTAAEAVRFILCTALIRPGDSPEARLASLKGFDCQTSVAELHAGSYWLRLLPQDPHHKLDTLPAGLSVLSFVPGWQQNGAIYVHHTDGTINWMALDNRTLSHETHVGAKVQLRLNTRSARPDAILVRLDQAVNNNGLLRNPSLRSEVASNRDEILETACYALFAGLSLALLMFNLALLGSMREKFQVTYCLMVVAMLIYAWSLSGGWSLWFPDRDITERFRLIYIARGLVAALGLSFFVDFLGPYALNRWLHALAKAVRVTLLIVTAVMVVIPLPFAQVGELVFRHIVALHQMSWTLIGIIMLVRGNRAAQILAPSWMALLGAGLINAAYFRSADGPSPWVTHIWLIAFAIVAATYAFAIALRVKALAEERDHARNEERIARRLADMDPLTGLLNRRGLLAQVGDDGQQGALRLLIVDVDHFKTINDNHGHDIGDDVLRNLARVLTRRVGRRGHVARLGGEEFAVVGKAGDLSPALALALLADVRQHRFTRGIKVTVSIGMAEGAIRSGLQGEADWAALYRRADIALYEAKTNGRNRVVDAAMMDAGMMDAGMMDAKMGGLPLGAAEPSAPFMLGHGQRAAS
ncbi:MAG: diguanylate cyclase [Sphingomonadales bacterium]|nr:diguanylate cyclase [Sphingomonadales bacterium]MDE2168056.1 diguanylate cyclase [Sphingomonadales bacterium]